jgi:hypothetical protein
LPTGATDRVRVWVGQSAIGIVSANQYHPLLSYHPIFRSPDETPCHILINTLTLQEAKDSSEIENIITTQEDLFRRISPPTKSATRPRNR